MNTADARDRFISYHLITLVLEEKDVELEYMLTLLPADTLTHHAIKDSLRYICGYSDLGRFFCLVTIVLSLISTIFGTRSVGSC